MRVVLLPAALLLLSAAASASVCNPVPVMDFEDRRIANWVVMYGGNTAEHNMTLSDLSHGGNYSILLWNSGGPNDFVATRMNTTLAEGKDYSSYNITFWYMAECPFSGGMVVYLSDEPTFELWSGVGINVTNIVSCGGWREMNVGISGFTWVSSGFSLEEDDIGSMNFETGNSKVYIDDIALIPAIPEVCCNESWSCSSWSVCHANSTRYRGCSDQNSCGTEDDRPQTEEGCACTPVWVCGSWSGCIGGSVIRECEDAHGCDIITYVPQLAAECAAEPTAAVTATDPAEVNLGGEVILSASFEPADDILEAWLHIILPEDGYSKERADVSNGTLAYIYNGTSVLGSYYPYIEAVHADGTTSWFQLQPFRAFGRLEMEASVNATAYRQGDTIRISGTTRTASGGPANCTANVTFSSGLWKKSVNSSSDGTFSLSYNIGVQDPPGPWAIKVLCTDGQMNMAKAEFEVEVVETLRFPYLEVQIISPGWNSTFYQGDELAIIAHVLRSNLSVYGAAVFAVLPDGSRIVMDETFGMYSKSIELPSGGQTGDMAITVNAVSGTSFGESNVTVKAMSSDLIARLIDPHEASYIAGERVHVKVNVTRSDGSPMPGLKPVVVTPSGGISLSDRGNGVYEVYYTTDPYISGEWIVALLGVDRLHYIEQTVAIRQPNVLDYIARYGQTAALAAMILFITVFLFGRRFVHRIESLVANKEISRIKAKQEELRESYFRRTEISRETFERANRRYEKRVSDLKKRLRQ